MLRILGALAVAIVALAPDAQASAPTDEGRVTGLVSDWDEARALPCGVGSVCLPKRAAHWEIDQVDGCTIRSDVTTGFRMTGTCVLDVDEGDHVKFWAPLGAVDEDFVVIWEG